MSIEIKLGFVDKPVNSTKQGSSYTTYTGNIKSPSSIINPDIEISGSISVTWTDGTERWPNHAYIEEFNRYYFIDDITYDQGFWILSLSVDVLATYKSIISNYERIIIRSSEVSNNDIIDNLYPATASITITDSSSLLNYEFNGFDNGQYVVGIKGKNNVTDDGVYYYLLTPTQFGLLMYNFYGNTSSWSSLGTNLINSLMNLDQYIACAYWYPDSITIATDGTTHDVYLGLWDSGIDAPKVTSYTAQTASSWSAIPKHPQASSRGTYLNYEPFSDYTIESFLFGTVHIQPVMLKNYSYYRAVLFVDVTKGKARIAIHAGTNSSGGNYKLIYFTYCDFGISLNIDGTTVNVDGVINGVVGSTSNIVTSNWLGALSGIGNAAMSAVPSPGMSIATGTIINIDDSNVMLRGVFKLIPSEDNERHGRPYCESEIIGELGGYMEVEKPAFSASYATEAETQRVDSLMESGFFFE